MVIVSVLAVVPAFFVVRLSWVPVAAAFLLWLGIPFAALSGGAILGLHPAALTVMAATLVLVLMRPGELLGAVVSALPVVVAAVTFCLVATVVTAVSRPEGLGTVANMSIAPLLAFGLVRYALWNPRSHSALRGTILTGAGVQAVIVLGVRFGLMDQPWSEDLRQAYSFYTDGFVRSFGTTDHPLVLAIDFAMATPLLLGLRGAVSRVGLGVLFMLATVTTESRSGLVLVAIAFVAVILKSTRSPYARVLTILIATGLLVVVVMSDLAASVMNKFADDGGSAGARTAGLEWTISNAHRFLFFGAGAGSSYDLTSSLPTSLESPLFMFVPDFGVMATAVFVGLVVAVLWPRHETKSYLQGGRLGGVFAAVQVVTFSSLAAFNSSAGLMWIGLGLAGAARVAAVTSSTTQPSPATYVQGSPGPSRNGLPLPSQSTAWIPGGATW